MRLAALRAIFTTSSRRLGHRHGLDRAFLVACAAGLALDDLPVPGGHVILAGEQRPPVEDADAPVELGGQPFLRDDQLRLLQQRVHLREQFLLRFHLDHPERKRAVGLLEHARQPEAGNDLGHVVVVHHQRARRGNVVAGEQFGEIHLVGALEDRFRIVDHHQAFRGRPPREAVGVVVDEGGVADEQRVELGQPAEDRRG